MKQDASKKTAPPTLVRSPATANANSANTNSANAASATTGDSLTDSLMALEKKGWEAWKARDQKALEDLTTAETAYVDPLGTTYATKADVMKAWIGPTCDIKSVSVTDGKATQITPDSAILTFRGDAEGTCDNNKVGPLWGTSVLVKTGDTWKMVLLLESPA